MKSIGFDTLRDSEGKGFLGCMTAIVVFTAVIFIGIKLGPVYYSNYTFEEELKTLVSRAGARYTSNEKIITDVLDLARQHNIDLTYENAEDNIRIERYAGQIHVNVQYFVPVDFLILQRKLRFQIKLSSFTAV